MTRTVKVLGVADRIQGQKFSKYIEVPDYKVLVEQFISLVDFVFEEAAGNAPTIAEALAKSFCEPRGYLDVDPSNQERPSLGIGNTKVLPCYPQFPVQLPPCELIDEHGKREKEWLKRIQAENFKQALFICGVAHSFSFAFRLQAAGINAEVYHYLPFEKLCGH